MEIKNKKLDIAVSSYTVILNKTRKLFKIPHDLREIPGRHV